MIIRDRDKNEIKEREKMLQNTLQYFGQIATDRGLTPFAIGITNPSTNGDVENNKLLTARGTASNGLAAPVLGKALCKVGDGAGTTMEEVKNNGVDLIFTSFWFTYYWENEEPVPTANEGVVNTLFIYIEWDNDVKELKSKQFNGI